MSSEEEKSSEEEEEEEQENSDSDTEAISQLEDNLKLYGLQELREIAKKNKIIPTNNNDPLYKRGGTWDNPADLRKFILDNYKSIKKLPNPKNDKYPKPPKDKPRKRPKAVNPFQDHPLNDLGVKELKQMAKSLGIPIGKKIKSELIGAIIEKQGKFLYAIIFSFNKVNLNKVKRDQLKSRKQVKCINHGNYLKKKKKLSYENLLNLNQNKVKRDQLKNRKQIKHINRGNYLMKKLSHKNLLNLNLKKESLT